MRSAFLLASLSAILPGLALAAEPAVAIIAHRGASFDAPENTLAALRLAWQQNADGSEFDVMLTRDQKIVAMHDKDTKRTAGVRHVVAQTSLVELRTLDVGRGKGVKFAGERIPTLEEMLAEIPAGKQAVIEVKCGPEIVSELDRVLRASRLKPEQTPVISFQADVIAALKKVRPDVPAYWLVSLDPKGKMPRRAEDVIATAKSIGANGLDVSATKSLTPEFVQKVKAAGFKLWVYTVNDPKVAKHMVALGVDGITTDKPAWLRKQLP